MQILKKDGASTLTVVESARALIPQIEAAAHATGLETLTARLEFDQSVFVRGALNAVLPANSAHFGCGWKSCHAYCSNSFLPSPTCREPGRCMASSQGILP